MTVRNFWVEADIDGYNSTPAGGPRRKDGGMNITVYQREDGEIKTAVRIFLPVKRRKAHYRSLHRRRACWQI